MFEKRVSPLPRCHRQKAAAVTKATRSTAVGVTMWLAGPETRVFEFLLVLVLVLVLATPWQIEDEDENDDEDDPIPLFPARH